MWEEVVLCGLLMVKVIEIRLGRGLSRSCTFFTEMPEPTLGLFLPLL